jgi:hypothetical protein
MWTKRTLPDNSIIYTLDRTFKDNFPKGVTAASLSVIRYDPLNLDQRTPGFMARTAPTKLSATLSIEGTAYRLSLELYDQTTFISESLKERQRIPISELGYNPDIMPDDDDNSTIAKDLRAILQETQAVEKNNYLRFTTCQRNTSGPSVSIPDRPIEPSEKDLVLPYIQRIFETTKDIDFAPPFRTTDFYLSLFK